MQVEPSERLAGQRHGQNGAQSLGISIERMKSFAGDESGQSASLSM